MLHHEFTGRGTQVVDVTMRETDGRTASTRFETQFLGPRKPYDLIAVVRSDPGETYGFLNFLDPEFLGSMRQEVMQEDNNLRDITFPLVYVGSGVNQAPDGEYVLLVMDRDHINVGLHRVVHEYNRRTKWLDPLGSSSCENIYPVWTTNPGNLILTYATNRRLLDTEEFEVRFDRPSPDWLQLIWAGDYLSDHSGVHVGPHRDFFGKHSAIHPDGFTIAFGPTPFDDNAGEVRRVALYHLTERTRRRFPEENALGDFLSSHFPAVDPTAVRVGENGMAFAPDVQRMAVTLYVEPLQKNILAMADLSGGDIQLFAGDGRMPSFSPDGNRIGYLNSENHLLIASVGSGASSAIDATVASGGQGKHDTAFAWTG